MLLPQEILAIFGATFFHDPYEAGRSQHSPQKIYIHGDWKHLTENYDADLSLMEFQEGSIFFTENVKPICLWYPESGRQVTEGILAGWAHSQHTGYTTMPKKEQVFTQTNEKCLPGHGKLAELSSERTFCARLSFSDDCFPVINGAIYIEVNGIHFLKGIASLQYDSCFDDSNTIFTNVHLFRNWIIQNTEKCKAIRFLYFKIWFEFFLMFVAAGIKVFCTFKVMRSEWFSNIEACEVKQTINSESSAMGAELDITVEGFKITGDVDDNEKARFLPRYIGKKFPNLKELHAESYGLTVVRNHYFEDLSNLQYLMLQHNRISTIEKGSFKDLTKVKEMRLNHNLIQSFDPNLFDTMLELRDLYADHNLIKILDPETFYIPDGSLASVDLFANACLDNYYGMNSSTKNMNHLRDDIRANCT